MTVLKGSIMAQIEAAQRINNRFLELINELDRVANNGARLSEVQIVARAFESFLQDDVKSFYAEFGVTVCISDDYLGILHDQLWGRQSYKSLVKNHRDSLRACYNVLKDLDPQ